MAQARDGRLFILNATLTAHLQVSAFVSGPGGYLPAGLSGWPTIAAKPAPASLNGGNFGYCSEIDCKCQFGNAEAALEPQRITGTACAVDRPQRDICRLQLQTGDTDSLHAGGVICRGHV